MSHSPCLPTLAFSSAGRSRLQQLWLDEQAVEAAWRLEPSPEKALELSRLQSRRELTASFTVENFSPLLLSGLLWEVPAPHYRLSWADDSLRLQAEGGFDVRLTQTDGQIFIEGRRRPAFNLYEYLTSRLGPDLYEESRVESAEGLQERRRDRDGRLRA